MKVFLEALKTKALELVHGGTDSHFHPRSVNQELLAKFVLAQNTVGSQLKKTKKGAAK